MLFFRAFLASEISEWPGSDRALDFLFYTRQLYLSIGVLPSESALRRFSLFFSPPGAFSILRVFILKIVACRFPIGRVYQPASDSPIFFLTTNFRRSFLRFLLQASSLFRALRSVNPMF